MKKKELQEIRKRPVSAIQKELRTARERVHSLNIDLSVGKVKSVHEFQGFKKRVAQLETLLHEKKEVS